MTDQEKYNSPEQQKLRKERLQSAKSYREYYLQPRFVRDKDNNKSKLEAGEFVKGSERYGMCTPIKDLSDFGSFLFFLNYYNESRVLSLTVCFHFYFNFRRGLP